MEISRTPASNQRQLVALTTDSALIRALQDLATDGTPVFILSDLRALSDELLQHAGAVALIDASSLDAPIDGVVDAFSTQFPDLRLLVAGQTPDQTMLTRRIASQAVFRFVHKPASPQRLKLFLDAAARPDMPRGQVAPSEPVFTDSSSLRRIDTAVRGRSPLMLGMIGVLAIAAIAAAAWVFWLKDNKPAAPAVAVAAPVTQPVSSPAALALIRKADRAFADARYVAQDGSSAAEFYREALKVEPGNAIARKGFDRSVDYGMRRAEEAMVAGKLNEAAAAAEALRPLATDNSRLAFLNSQIEKEQARVNADASQRAANEARQGQIRDSLTTMSERMRRGALLDPANSSAIMYFRQAESINPADPQVRSARDALVGALLTAADAELTGRKAPAARRLTDAASTLNSSAPGLDAMRRRIDEFTEQQVAASAAAEAARAAEATRAAAAVAAAAAAAPVAAAAPKPAASTEAAPSVVAATTLKLVRSAPPEYPQRALEQLVSGWVDMEFTVSRDGNVKDIVVKASEPDRTFDSAAVTAMRRYRYEPVMRNGAPVEQRARLRVRFTAKDGR